MKVQIGAERCQGHGRCYDLAPDLFGDDDEGYGRSSATAPCRRTRSTTPASRSSNCPERAIES